MIHIPHGRAERATSTMHVCDLHLVADDTLTLLRSFKKKTQWGLCPYGCWTEADGSGVIFDRCYRPIIRVRRGGKTEIVAPDEFIRFRKQRWFHHGFGPTPDAATHAVVTQIVATYNLGPELRRRSALLRRGLLPRWNGHGAAA